MKSSEAFLVKYYTLILIFIIFLAPPFCISLVLETITPNHPTKDSEFFISSQQTFVLGFFSPGKSRYRYVGIWYYKVSEQTVVWVANRDNPIIDTTGVLAIENHGRLNIYAKYQNSPLWSANISVPLGKTSATSMAKILDVGNLVLLQNNSFGQSNNVIWQSFDYPTNTWLPYIKLGLNPKCGLEWFITSWKSEDDPGTGTFTSRIDLTGYPKLVAYKGRVPYWRGGPWMGRRWSTIPESRSSVINESYVSNKDEVSLMERFVRKSGAQTCGSGEGFMKLTRVTALNTSTTHVEMGLSLREYGDKCLKDCNCTAYMNTDETKDGVGCLTWHGDLIDIRTYTIVGLDL